MLPTDTNVYDKIVKVNSKMNLNSIFPAYREISKYKPNTDSYKKYYIAAKHYPSLLDMQLKTNINYDLMMCKLKDMYLDSFNREVKVFYTESETLQYLLNK